VSRANGLVWINRKKYVIAAPVAKAAAPKAVTPSKSGETKNETKPTSKVSKDKNWAAAAALAVAPEPVRSEKKAEKPVVVEKKTNNVVERKTVESYGVESLLTSGTAHDVMPSYVASTPAQTNIMTDHSGSMADLYRTNAAPLFAVTNSQQHQQFRGSSVDNSKLEPCFYCHAMNLPKFVYCCNCGTPAVRNDTCSSCAQTNLPGFRFCHACGTPSNKPFVSSLATSNFFPEQTSNFFPEQHVEHMRQY
jgi:hypothetical protein